MRWTYRTHLGPKDLARIHYYNNCGYVTTRHYEYNKRKKKHTQKTRVK